MSRRERASVRRRGGRWQARRTVGGRTGRVELSASGRTQREALDRLEERVRAWERGGELGDVDGWTVGRFLEWWLGELEERAAEGSIARTTYVAHEHRTRLHVVPYVGGVKLARLGPAHVRRMLQQQRAAGASVTVRRSALQSLNAALNAGVRYELLAANPAAHVPRPRADPTPRATLDYDELAEALLAALPGDRLEALWRLMLAVPLRIGEARALAYDDGALDLDAGSWVVARNLQRAERRWRLQPTKGRNIRTVPLPAGVVEALRARRAASAAERLELGGWGHEGILDTSTGGLVWPWLAFTSHHGGPLDAKVAQLRLDELCARAGAPRVTTHDLRRAAITRLTRRGVHPRVVQQLAGHASLDVQDTYVGELGGAMREAVDGLEGAP